MNHTYYSYNKEEILGRKPGIKCEILEDNEKVFRAMADEMFEEIDQNNRESRRTVLICPVGPVGQYPYFVERVNQENLSLKDVWFINMDEYLDDDREWISKEHPLSFRGFMERNVYSRIKPQLLMPPEQRVFPDPHKLSLIPELIEKLGGVDIAFGGIGINGHVAFNEADEHMDNQEFLELPTRILEISPETRTANAIGDFQGALEDMPHYCVTIGMKEIASAGKIRLGAFRSWHRAVVRRAMYSEPSPAFPVTLLQNHADILLRFTEFVARLTD